MKSALKDEPELLAEVEALYPAEFERKFLIKMKEERALQDIVGVLGGGKEWPGYRHHIEDRDIMVRGYIMGRDTLDITLSNVGWWTGKETIEKAFQSYGEIVQIEEKKIGHMKTDAWQIKIIKKKDVVIPPIIWHLGSDRSGEDREMWKVFYRGVPRICYKCGSIAEHVARDCPSKSPLSLWSLGQAPALGEEQEPQEGEERSIRKTFADVVKEDTFRKFHEERVKKADDEATRKKESDRMASVAKAAAAAQREEEKAARKRLEEEEKKVRRETRDREKAASQRQLEKQREMTKEMVDLAQLQDEAVKKLASTNSSLYQLLPEGSESSEEEQDEEGNVNGTGAGGSKRGVTSPAVKGDTKKQKQSHQNVEGRVGILK